MRQLDTPEQFDAVVCWFTTFGLFEDDVLRDILHRVRRALRDGGRLLLEVLNRSRLLEQFEPHTAVERDGAVMLDFNRFDPLTERTWHRRLIARGADRRWSEFSMRHFTFTELRDWLLAAGFDSVAGFGGDGEVFDEQSTRMITVAR